MKNLMLFHTIFNQYSVSGAKYNVAFYKKYILQPLFLISFGGMAYFNFEILFRGYSHISMIICGGLCFYTIGLLNEGKNWHPSFLFQMILGSLIIITYEYLTGVIVNIYLNLHVWDYSKVPFNYRDRFVFLFLLYGSL